MSASHGISRRRLIRISAAFCGAGLLANGLMPRAARAITLSWRGIALGAPATITLSSDVPEVARAAIRDAVAELRRLEAVFSLYRPDSALSRLNRDGTLKDPPLDLVRLLSEASGVSAATDGAFDVTIQPLWDLYARHFARHPESQSGPPPEAVSEARARVNYRAVSARPGRIAFERPGMAVSLNGIAQGYITDRVADVLRRRGFGRILIDLGETRALGSHPSGRPWRVGVRTSEEPDAIVRTFEVMDGAVATSAPGATPFDRTGAFHHLIDPRTGHCVGFYRTLTVRAPNATLADGLSTAFALMPWPKVAQTARRIPHVTIDALDLSDRWHTATR